MEIKDLNPEFFLLKKKKKKTKSIYINRCKNFVNFSKKKNQLFSILHTYFYKTLISVCLFYTFIQ